MELLIFIICIGYILWNIFIIKGSEFNDKQEDIYLTCALYAPILVFVCVYVFICFMFGEEGVEEFGDTGVFALSVVAAYMSPLFVYQIIQWFNQIIQWFNQIVEFIKNKRELRRLLKECEKLSDTSKQEEIRILTQWYKQELKRIQSR